MPRKIPKFLRKFFTGISNTGEISVHYQLPFYIALKIFTQVGFSSEYEILFQAKKCLEKEV
jgi:hypothetical protein